HGARTVFEVNDADGSSSPESLLTTLTQELDAAPPDVILTCGSNRLITLSETLAERWNCTVQVSVEAHMACGIGYCHGCASGARSEGAESPLNCNDGPVFAWKQLEGENAWARTPLRQSDSGTRPSTGSAQAPDPMALSAQM